MPRDYYVDYFPPSSPLVVRGGIKAQTQRGDFGENWWAKRWLQALENLQIGGRLARGRTYARQGQVLDIHIENGIVRAVVQGSRREPYNATIKVATVSGTELATLAKSLSGSILFTARLMAGEMPEDIEEAFAAAGISLFPQKQSDLAIDCTCPDWAKPCKHVAAVYYLLGEEFDRDPFLIFKLRGIDLASVLAPPPGKAAKPRGRAKNPRSGPPPQPAPDAALFWNGTTLPERLWGDVQLPPADAALPRRLGNFPFWRGRHPLLPALEPLYAAAGRRGLKVYLGERTDESPPRPSAQPDDLN